MTKRKLGNKKGPKVPKYSLSDVLTALDTQGEAAVIGLKADMGDEASHAVIAQYVHYLRHPRDPERIRLLCVCYEQYKKAEHRQHAPVKAVEPTLIRRGK